MAKAVVFFAEGTEECEALLVVDLLRRAKVEVYCVRCWKLKKRPLTDIKAAYRPKLRHAAFLFKI